jgi:hypothetical protein
MKGVKIYNFQRNNHLKNIVMKKEENVNSKKENLSNNLSSFTRSNSTSNIILQKQINDLYLKEKPEKLNDNKENIIKERNSFDQINYDEKINQLEKRIIHLEEIIKNYEELLKKKEFNSSDNFPFNNITNYNEIDYRLNELENQVESIKKFYKQYINTNSNEGLNINFDINNFSQLKKKVEQNSNDLKIIIEDFNEFYSRNEKNTSKINESIDSFYEEISNFKENISDLNNKMIYILELINDNPSEEELFLKNIQKN